MIVGLLLVNVRILRLQSAIDGKPAVMIAVSIMNIPVLCMIILKNVAA